MLGNVKAAGLPKVNDPSIIINLPSRTLELYSGNTLVKEYPVAIGKPSTPTPIGEYLISYKEINPWWYPPGKGYAVPSGPDNPLGYRWMSFLGNYGIHGTNAPWSIGEVISNGCVRMHEENAEELFDAVSIGTPVKVTYDRVKVRINNNGEVLVGVFPDVYGYGEVSINDVRKKLERFNINEIFSDRQILSLIENEHDEMLKVAQLFNIRVNGKLIAERAFMLDTVKYVPVQAVADALVVKLLYNDANSLIQVNGKSVQGFTKGKTVYISEKDCQTLFGNLVWIEDEQKKAMLQEKMVVQINGKTFYMKTQKVERIMAVSLFDLARGLGVDVQWDALNNTLRYNNRQIVINSIDGEPFIKLTEIYNVFNAYVYWDIEAGRIELTYPFIPPATDFL